MRCAMMEAAQRYIATGQAALMAGDWHGARVAYEASLSEQDSPEARDGLGAALWWLNDIARAHEQKTAAYLGYKQDANYRRAALIAAWLAREQVFLHGNTHAMNGWFARAARLLHQAGACPEHGWITLFQASMQATDE